MIPSDEERSQRGWIGKLGDLIFPGRARNMTLLSPRGGARFVLACTTLAGCILAGGALAGCKKVDCDQVCHRVRQCKGEVSQALVDRQPSQSRFMNHVRKHLPERMVPRLIESCTERCRALRNSKKWHKKLKACAALKNCEAFARCIAPALEP